ncbi:hypothetical protein [Microbacterium sp. RU33B]|uniref:hypothetical protein n=1 Tax=Microbacterium sp. RU33B TaxID=1907390 RepID=UPI00095DEED0|nr:hypothetical protein [Microbacterium sp. RU33B]SIT75073.1 hypothetical protein SAMN05880545_1423 [Microbacterium sp. RU33B]
MDLYVVPAGVRGIADALESQVDEVSGARPTFSWSDLGPAHVSAAFSDANRAGHDARAAVAARIEILARACDRAAGSFESVDRGLARSASTGAAAGAMRVQ